MAIFAPQNVMGPAHRSGVIQQLAQGAAQNVMRRQKLKALLQNTAAQGRTVGGGQPFRGSTMGHATGVRGSTFRPGAAAPLGSPGQNAMASGDPMPVNNYPDAGPQDLPSIPNSNDPAQSPQSTQPGQTVHPNNGTGLTNSQLPVGQQIDGLAPDAPVISSSMGSQGSIPLGGGYFYDPATQQVTGGNAIRPGLQM